MFIVSILRGLTMTPEGMFGVQIDHIYFLYTHSWSYCEGFTGAFHSKERANVSKLEAGSDSLKHLGACFNN